MSILRGMASGGGGSLEHVDYAFEVKNSGLSSHSDQWEHDAGDFAAPAFSGRIGYRPDAAWAFGVSASYGSYLAEEAEALLPPGVHRSDLTQTTAGFDVRWAHRHWIVSGEVIASQYETLAAGDLRTPGWFLQARWKAAPGLWLAGRFGQLSSATMQTGRQAPRFHGQRTSGAPNWQSAGGSHPACFSNPTTRSFTATTMRPENTSRALPSGCAGSALPGLFLAIKKPLRTN